MAIYIAINSTGNHKQLCYIHAELYKDLGYTLSPLSGITEIIQQFENKLQQP